MAPLFANSGDPDQTPRSAASDLGLHYLPITCTLLLAVTLLKWAKRPSRFTSADPTTKASAS